MKFNQEHLKCDKVICYNATFNRNLMTEAVK